MATKVVAVVGLSGVGKTTFLTNLATKCSFAHYTASQILKSEFKRLNRKVPTSEELRLGSVEDNQKLLFEAFHRLAYSNEGAVVFDGHVIIDGADGVQRISYEIFQRIGTEHMILLEASPLEISLRRRSDKFRIRPDRTVEQITMHQRLAQETAIEICNSVGCPLTVLNADNWEEAANIIRS